MRTELSQPELPTVSSQIFGHYVKTEKIVCLSNDSLILTALLTKTARRAGLILGREPACALGHGLFL